MANSRQKGNTFENKIKEYLISLGYRVDKARAKLLWLPDRKFPISSPCDLLEFADLIAVHPNRPYTLFIQATINPSNVSVRRKKAEDLTWNLSVQRVQVWCKDITLRGRVRVFSFKEDRTWTELAFKPVAGAVPEGCIV